MVFDINLCGLKNKKYIKSKTFILGYYIPIGPLNPIFGIGNSGQPVDRSFHETEKVQYFVVSSKPYLQKGCSHLVIIGSVNGLKL